MITIPYIKKENRPALDKYLDKILELNLSNKKLTIFLYEVVGRRYYIMDNPNSSLAKEFNENVKPDGSINYILFKYAKYHIKPSYNNYKNLIGAIMDASGVSPSAYRDEYREAAEWIRIKLLIPYEEEAIKRNGDV